MSAIFLKDDIYDLFKEKYVVILGSSVQRSVYKDMVRLLQENNYLTDDELRRKGEPKFAKDECLVGHGGMHNGSTCREVRQYCTDFHLIRYYYITRCWNPYLQSVLKELTVQPYPDVIIMNSCIWDITRYGVTGIEQYQKNMPRLLDHIKEIIPESCVFIWLSTLPVSITAKGGFIAPDMEIEHDRLRLDTLAANLFNHKLIKKYGFDFLDIHYFLRNHLHRRAEDGIHWDMTAHRRMTNMILSHICTAWGHELPGHAATVFEKAVLTADKDIEKFQTELNTADLLDAETIKNQKAESHIDTREKKFGFRRGRGFGSRGGSRDGPHHGPPFPRFPQGPPPSRPHPLDRIPNDSNRGQKPSFSNHNRNRNHSPFQGPRNFPMPFPRQPFTQQQFTPQCPPGRPIAQSLSQCPPGRPIAQSPQNFQMRQQQPNVQFNANCFFGDNFTDITDFSRPNPNAADFLQSTVQSIANFVVNNFNGNFPR